MKRQLHALGVGVGEPPAGAVARTPRLMWAPACEAPLAGVSSRIHAENSACEATGCREVSVAELLDYFGFSAEPVELPPLVPPLSTIEGLYQERNMVLAMAGTLARAAGVPVYFRFDEMEPDWPVLVLQLPTGQVSWHVRQTEREAWFKHVENVVEGEGEGYDGHTTAEKYARVLAYSTEKH